MFRDDSKPTSALIDGSEHYLSIALPSREHPSYEAVRDLLKNSGFILEPSNRRWWLRDRHKTLTFLAAHGARFRGEWGAAYTPNFTRNTANIQMVAMTATAAPEEGGARGQDGYSVTLSLAAGAAGPGELRGAIDAGRAYLESGGRIHLIEAGVLKRFTAAQQKLAGDPNAPLAATRSIRIKKAALADAEAILEQLSPAFRPPESWRAQSEGLRRTSQLAPAPMPPELGASLRPYQRLGVAWLWALQRARLGGILADEMGLGKTAQALGLLACMAKIEPGRTSLVVAPASLLENWRREAGRFTPELRVFVHHGTQRIPATASFSGWDAVITSYGTLARDRELFAGVAFACAIADEAQHIKNRRSQNAAALRSIGAGSRFLLTGTPVENSLDDLRSLFEFVLPGYIARPPDGMRGEQRSWHDERLRSQTAPYILRRTKQSVAPELPEKLEQVVWCELAPDQAALYRRIQERTEREMIDLAAGGASEANLRFAALTQLLRLRQVCCDPRLVGERGIESAKLAAFREILEEAADDGHRVLVFSQFTSLLALLREELTSTGTAYCSLDGSMNPNARQQEVDRFQSSPEIPVFLLSLKAGGTGLNLTGADTVVHFDPWWNPAVEAQATDRAHRIGQTKKVTAYKLIASGTVEEKVLALQDAKRALLADVFEASDAAASRLTLADLQSLLAP